MFKQSVTILLIEDNLAEARLLEEFLLDTDDNSFQLIHVQRLREGLQKLQEEQVDVILLDLTLPDSQGLGSLASVNEISPAVPIVVLTNMNDDQMALEAVRQGAQDYLVKRQVSSVDVLTRSLYYAIERKQIQEQLLQANKTLEATNRLLEKEIAERENVQQELQRSNQELEQFAYIVSHDLKQPLSTVSCWAQMLQKYYHGQLDGKAQKYIKMVIDGTQEMNQLIEDLLTYSRIGTKQQEFQLTDCEQVLMMVKARLEGAISRTKAIIISEKLPKLMVDPVQITQLFQNLIDNGIKYHRDVTPEIRISAVLNDDPSKPEWLFTVRDNGIGIDAQYVKQIFGIFQRLHSQEEYSGTGIGLAVCEKIVKRHGGKIWVESEVGEGSTFYFTMPHR